MAKKEIETNNKKETKEVVFITKELKHKETSSEEYRKVKGFIILVVIFVALIAGLALLNGNFVTKDYVAEETTTTTEEIEYDSSLLTINNVFGRSEKNYMVLFYNSKDDTDKEFAETFANKYTDETVKLYKVDMGSAMNSAYYDESATDINTKPKNLDELKINGVTLITFKKGKVSSYETDKLAIAQALSTTEDEK